MWVLGLLGLDPNLRLSPEELAELAEAAERSGITVTGYAARAALSAARQEMPPDAREFAVQLFAVRREVARVGVNLNQIARRLNGQQAVPPATVEAALRAARQALEQVGETV
jgi:uncharacterized protein (DUF1778 family)